ncbi:MAG: hypothetical protein COY40_02140 [Alphaproteobacteria bacterium CG_4_10_14_0_8_um_filter_53_9]|nr:MAG: hypothetical protein COY40_02140 [Alphaproteobacteria bacterium CG_4_10_14_0_8_um_filter_53_9]
MENPFQTNVTLKKLATVFPKGSLALVGGSTRNILQNLPLPEDIDLTTTLPPEAASQLLTQAHIPHNKDHIKYGNLTLLEDGIELTSTRRDTYTAGSRYPQSSFGATWDEDAARRDFTIGAIYLYPNGDLYDPVGGREDLENAVVRFIKNPHESLAEDPLRLLRFARFSAKYGMGGWTEEMNELFEPHIPALQSLSKNKQTREMDKLKKEPHAVEALKKLESLGYRI